MTTTSGLPLVLSHFAALAIAAAWLGLLTALGHALLDRLSTPPPESDEPPLDRLLLGLAMGAGAAATAFLAMGAVGMLRPWFVLASAAATAVLLRHAIRRTLGLLRAAVRSAGIDVRRAGRLPWSWVLVAVLLTAALIVGVAPVTDWDSLMYHLTVPARWLENGWIHVPPDNLHVSRTGLLQMLYVLPLALGEPRAATLTGLGFALALCLAVYSLVRWHFGVRAAVFAGATFWAPATIWFVAVTPRNDVALVFFLLLAHDQLLRGLGREGRRPLALAGVLLGLAVATKFQALAYALALLPLALLDRPVTGSRRSLAAVGTRMGIVMAGAVVVALPWLIKNALLLGAPLYPLLSSPVPPPWVESLAGAGAAVLPDSLGQTIWGASERFGFFDFFFRPGRLNVEEEAALYRPNFLLLALALLPFVRKERRKLLTLVAPGLLYVGILLLGFPRASLRYLLPALVPLGAAAAVIALRLLERLPRSGLLAAVVASAVLLPATTAARRAMHRAEAHRHAAGSFSADRYLTYNFEYGPLHDALERTGELDEDARVLMIFDGRGFRAPRAVLQDNMLTNWPYIQAAAAARGADRCLAGTGITHVLVNRWALEYYSRSAGFGADALGVDALEGFTTRCAETLWERRGMSLYRIAPAEPLTTTGP
ncbi:MAG: glycosyltransferase family 39 protein [Gemmatimonadetes bacterium]|nr:glycosyltransferase family 39 protein [Gemmatimonadota bacterium]